VQAFADPASGAAPLDVHLSATGLDPDGGTVRYRWTIGDGTVLGPEFDWTFTTPGVHTATVTVTDDEGDTATDEVEVNVTEAGSGAPIVEASVDKPSGPAPHAVRLSATGSDDGPADQLEYRWDFGDGGSGSFDEDPDHTYTSPGTYTAKVTVTDAGGRTGTDEVQVTVTDPPGNKPPVVEAAALPRSGNAPLNVLFTAEGSDPDGDDLTYAWDYGDGGAGSGWKASHTYTAGGAYTAKVTVTDEGGMTASATVPITVGNPPGNQAPTVQAAADPAGGTAPVTVRFTSSGRDPEGQSLMYVWDFGDGGQAGGRSANHTYTTPGTYDAKVTVTDPQGATGTATVRVVVAAPVAAGGVRTAQAELAVPSSARAFRTRGLRVTLSCDATGKGRATLKVTRQAAKRLKLKSRTVAARRLRCTAGKSVALRPRPTRSTARRLVRSNARTLRLTLAVSVNGRGALQRKVTIR
jgi:large repetitive protein